LTISIADDTSMQVSDIVNNQPFEFLNFGCSADQGTADSGVLASVGGVVYGPDFANHPCGTSANTYTPWTPVSISGVTGSGAANDPFTVVVVVDAGATGLRLTETLTYVNGSTLIHPTLSFSATTAVTWDTFLAGDRYGPQTRGILLYGSPGAVDNVHQGAPFPACGYDVPYYVLFPQSPRYSANPTQQVWDEISGGSLSNTVYFGCPSTAIASEWSPLTLAPGGSLTLDATAISFVAAFPQTQVAIPALSQAGLLAVIVGLGAAGWILARRG
jgi:hypothetical protein